MQTAKRETSAEIDDLAARWAAKVDRAPLSAEDQTALEAWLAGDLRRLGAYAKARAVSAHMDRARALGAGYQPTAFGSRRSGVDRRALFGGLIAAAATGVALTGGWWAHQRGRFSTRLGEQRTVPLADGSTVTLNTATRIVVRYTDGERRVRLIDGEALFTVAKNPNRPFIVEAGETRVRAIGTSFSVRQLTDAVQVLVREGVVEVRQAAVATPAVRMAANTRVVASPSRALAPKTVEPTEVNQELAWREGMIAFEGQTLAQAAAEFARYSDTPIVIDDPRVAEQTITGLFAANNPVGFAKAVARSLELRVDVEPDRVRLS